MDESKVTCPVLAISGAEDRITPASAVKRVAKKYKAEYQEFENHAHCIILEPGWRDAAAFISDWIRRAANNRRYPAQDIRVSRPAWTVSSR